MYKKYCNIGENGGKRRTTVIAVLLAAGLTLTACGADNEASDSAENTETESTETADTETESMETEDTETEDTEMENTETEDGDEENSYDIKKPSTENGVSTWDCVWFGNYWQNTDSNGDGKVTQEDDKEPIKWRVLDIDADGNAFLISDQLIDVIEINPEEKEMTWENSILRSYLNSYDSSFNAYEIDYSSSGFLNNAFSEEEISAITVSSVINEDNPALGTEGGNDTEDRIFCMSVAEATTPEYGFVSNEFTEPEDSKKKVYTVKDPTRNAVTTSYSDNKEGIVGKETERSRAPYWTRTSGKDLIYPGHVSGNGGAYCASMHMDEFRVNIRPVLRINLYDSSSLWSYAGTVSAGGEE